MLQDREIIDSVRQRHAPDTELQISRTIPGFFGGDLFVVDVLKAGQPFAKNYVYAWDDSVRKTFLSMDDLAVWVSVRSRNRRSGTSLLTVEAISGLIAILITVTICTMVVIGLITSGVHELRIPDILSNALTIILGFYFGSQVNKAVSEQKKPAEDDHMAGAGHP